MRIQGERRPGVLMVSFGEKALVRAPDWSELLAQRRMGTLLVVLDLSGAEFISSLFLQGCVELARVLGRSGQQLALLNLASHQERLFEFVEGASRLALLHGEADVDRHLEALAAIGQAKQDEGVTGTEKLMLWD